MKHKTTPTYFQWLFEDHYFKDKRGMLKFVGTLYGIVQAIYATPLVYDEWYYGYMPIWPLIGAYIAIYGFLIGITLQPYGIYKRLKRMNWWDRVNDDFK